MALMALRWSLTEGAYNKYAHYFNKELPIEIPANSPVATASHLRDIIKWAHLNHRRGGELYGKVRVSPQEGKIVKIIPLLSVNAGLPTHNIFDLMGMLANGIPHGYKAHVSDGVEAVLALQDGFPQYHFTHLHADIVEFQRVEGGLL